MDPQLASMLAALSGAGASSSYAAPSSTPLAGAGQHLGADPTQISWGVPTQGTSPYMPGAGAFSAPAPAPPAPMPDTAQPLAAPPAPTLAASAPDVPQPPLAQPTDPGTMPGSLGAGAPAQPGAAAPAALGAGQMAPGAGAQLPDFYRALFSGGGAPPAAGYYAGG